MAYGDVLQLSPSSPRLNAEQQFSHTENSHTLLSVIRKHHTRTRSRWVFHCGFCLGFSHHHYPSPSVPLLLILRPFWVSSPGHLSTPTALYQPSLWQRESILICPLVVFFLPLLINHTRNQDLLARSMQPESKTKNTTANSDTSTVLLTQNRKGSALLNMLFADWSITRKKSMKWQRNQTWYW